MLALFSAVVLMPAKHRLIPIVVLCLLAACKSEPPKARAIGEAWVAQGALPMRGELSTRADAVAELKYGEKLEVLQMRRRFLKVRNMGGMEGWVDSRALLTTGEIAILRQTIELAAKLPSQGSAVVYDAVNIHALPNRSSPSPFQIPAGGSVEITAHTVTERVPYQPKILAELLPPKPPPSAKKPKKRKGKKGEDTSVEPPPMPAAPKLPEDWIELSKTDVPEDPEPVETEAKKGKKKAKVEPPQIKADDWYLVRTPDKKAGWVLSRMMNVSIPDEVATYAEGRRITSYFSLGEITDEELEEKKRVKHHWLWTTMSQGLRPFQFDGLRVFIYNTRRHRYETAYREREIKGFYPVLQHPVQIVENRKTLTAPGFTVFTEDEDGKFWRRTFALYGYRIRAAGSQRVESMGDPMKPESILTLAQIPAVEAPPAEKSVVERVKKILKR